jgi:hypothetical protein
MILGRSRSSNSLGESREFGFQGYHLVRLKYPVFNGTKNHKIYKETGKYDPSMGKNNQQRFSLRKA